MMLEPVRPGYAPTLRDRDARRPADLADRDAARALLDEEVRNLGRLQQKLRADGRHALLVILQGRDASGKDGTIRNVFAGCDPQGCRVTSFGVPSALELSHDFLWRVHAHVPPRGFIGIFNRSHYEDVIAVRVRRLASRSVWRTRYDQINQFERMLSLNGVTILKFFLHISREEQRERLVDRLDDPEENWKFRAGDLDDRRLWPAYTRAYRDALSRCSTAWAPWFVVPADSKFARNLLVTRRINDALRQMRLRYPRVPASVKALRRTIT